MSDLQPCFSSAALASSTRVLLLGSSAVVTIVSWLWLVRAGDSHGIHSALLTPNHHHLEFPSFIYVLLMWTVMTFAMMTPTVLRWLMTLAAFASAANGGGSPPTLRLAGEFAGGYFTAWLAYSTIGSVLQVTLQQVGVIAHGRLRMSIAGLVLIVAGLFQFTPLKHACLTHCRNPLTYLLSRWPNRLCGGFRLGLTHGAYCIGCCWLLMMTGFAMGVMNTAWMAAVTLAVAVEQIVPHGHRIAQGLGAAMCAWGVALLSLGF